MYKNSKNSKVSIEMKKNFICLCMVLIFPILIILGCDSNSRKALPTSPEITPINWTLVPFGFVTEENQEIIDVGLYAVPELIDIDNDGDLDLFVGEWWGRISFYENIGSSKIPLFSHVTDSFNLIDVGRSAAPSFADIDNDGDYDLFIGTYYTVGPFSDTPEGKIYFYRNIGTPELAAFEFVTDSFINIPNMGLGKPEFVDFDGDDDLDLVVAYSETDLEGGKIGILQYQNDGTKNNAVFNLLNIDLFDWNLTERIDVFPTFADVDSDGNLDAILGTHNTIYYYKYTVTDSSI